MKFFQRLVFVYVGSILLLLSLNLASANAQVKIGDLNNTMQMLLHLTSDIHDNLVKKNFQVVSLSTEKILIHGKASSDVMAKLVQHLGTEAMEYKALEIEMYYQAKILLKAAKEKNSKQSLLQYQLLLAQCRACHERFNSSRYFNMNHTSF